MTDTRRSLSDLQTLLADNLTRAITPQNLRDLLVSVDPENTKQYGPWASRPTGPRKGDIYLSSDSLYLSISPSNNNWNLYGPLYPYIKPDLSGFSWNNQGNATLTSYPSYSFLYTPGNSSLQMQQYLRTLNTYCIIGFKPHLRSTCSIGLVIRESSTDKLYSLHIFYDAITIACDVSRYTNSTTYLNNAATQQAVPSRTLLFLKYRQDSTNRYFSYSYDLFNWIDIFSESKTASLTANQVGFFVSNVSSAPSAMSLYHLDYD